MKFSLSVALLSAAGANARAIAQYAREVDASTAAATSYDFIVIGGGTGGLTVADRLTEDPKTKVLVVEYAEFDKGDDTIYVPGSYLPVPYLWLGLVTTPQEALGNKVYNVPIGRVVGGGSGVNAMMFFRGTKADYKLWGDMGNRGWDWNSLLPYFKKSETFNKPDPAFAKKYNISWDDSVHGTSGPVQASFSNWDWPSSQNWWNGAMSAGIGAAKDPNDGESQGLYWLVRAKDPKTQTRSWAKTAHYDRVKTRSNYHIITNSAVSKIILEGPGSEKRAVGVEFINRASLAKSTARASKEIILSAGAVHSPKVLQLSGIGPRTVLDKFGIKTIVDLPGVGMNLQDHVAVKVGYNYTSHIEPNLLTLQNNATWDKEMRKQYDEKKTGPYTLVRGTGNNMLKVPLKTITSKATFNKIVALAKSQKAADIYPKDIHPEVLRGYQSQREKMINDFSLETTGIGSLAWNTGSETTIYFIKPLSRGSVSLASADPLQNPLVNYRTVTDPTDLQNLLALYRKNREIMATKEMQALGPIETRPAAGKESDADIIQAIKDGLEPSNAHQCCTLAMQKRNEGGVVNDQLLVYGVKGLSVADASFWPVNLAGAPHATIYAAAERAADLIKARHKIKTCPTKKRSL